MKKNATYVKTRQPFLFSTVHVFSAVKAYSDDITDLEILPYLFFSEVL